MKNWCKYCGKGITNVGLPMAFWSDSGGHIICNNGLKYTDEFHAPLAEYQVVDKILTKYGNEV